MRVQGDEEATKQKVELKGRLICGGGPLPLGLDMIYRIRPLH
jgi:hypothetical protein